VLGVPVVRVSGDEGAARGAGILALVGAGVYGGLEEALQATQPAELDAPPAQAEIRALQPGYRQTVELMLERYQSWIPTGDPMSQQPSLGMKSLE
ncbi:MAG: hypothetical protein N2318_02095, partial [Meiothermus sp.]|nr:hypothetical protein [Meiothermus sp.]